jgi:hypothetical protein
VPVGFGGLLAAQLLKGGLEAMLELAGHEGISLDGGVVVPSVAIGLGAVECEDEPSLLEVGCLAPELGDALSPRVTESVEIRERRSTSGIIDAHCRRHLLS